MTEILAQGIGLVAMAIGVLSYQQKTQKKIVLMQFCSSVLFTVHFGLLRAVMGCLLNAIGILRAAIFSQRERKWAAHPIWVFVFSFLFFLTYVLSFAMFGTAVTPENLIIEFLPVFGMLCTTVAYRCREARLVRMLSLSSSPAWLTYNLWNRSLGGALTEIFTILSIVIGMLRLDRRKRAAVVPSKCEAAEMQFADTDTACQEALQE